MSAERIRKVLSYYKGRGGDFEKAMDMLGSFADDSDKLKEIMILGVMAWMNGYRTFSHPTQGMHLTRLADLDPRAIQMARDILGADGSFPVQPTHSLPGQGSMSVEQQVFAGQLDPPAARTHNKQNGRAVSAQGFPDREEPIRRGGGPVAQQSNDELTPTTEVGGDSTHPSSDEVGPAAAAQQPPSKAKDGSLQVAGKPREQVESSAEQLNTPEKLSASDSESEKFSAFGDKSRADDTDVNLTSSAKDKEIPYTPTESTDTEIAPRSPVEEDEDNRIHSVRALMELVAQEF